jgi:hypothetical protein
MVHSHRIYAAKIGDQMSAWLNKNAAAMERALMEWNGMPSPDSFDRQLPGKEGLPSGTKATPPKD